MRQHLMYLVMFLLILALLFLAGDHPWKAWRWPVRIFCVLALFWLVPETASALRWLISLIKGRGKIPAQPKRRLNDEEIYEDGRRRRDA